MAVSIWHKFVIPPWGGGNQFLLALKKSMSNNNLNVQENIINEYTKACLINAISFDLNKFKDAHKKRHPKTIHRVDGPVFLIRGWDKEKDDICFNIINKQYASSTVVQSRWMLKKIMELGYDINNPVVICNASDPYIFNRNNKMSFSLDRKIKLVSTSWSNNIRKGRDVYSWIDDNLDWNKFEYTFIGNIDGSFKHIKRIGPVNSDILAETLKQNDIFITASRNDPCSNSLIEALSCGLPSLYFNDGGHPEIVNKGGLPFNSVDEIPCQLEKIVNNYDNFQSGICVDSMSVVFKKYMNLLMP